MPLPGGASDKSGNKYELLWTVVCMARVLNGEADSIYLEPVGEEGEGVEFTVTRLTTTEYHQVKYKRTGRGDWTLPVLAKEGVLGHFYKKLNAQSARTVFVSAHNSPVLEELADRARRAPAWETFERGFLSSDVWAKHFDDLHQRWGSTSKKDSYERLQRVYVEFGGENIFRELAHAKLGILLDGDPANASDILALFALDQIHRRLTADDLWQHLYQRGFQRQTWADDAAVTDVMAELNRTYRAGMQPRGIGGDSVPRSETERILEYFNTEDAQNIALVTGTAGVGKTSVISQVLDDGEIMEMPMLALRVDRLEPAKWPEALGKHMGLPASPVRTLAAVARGQNCLLVIDQLDAVSVASGRNPQFFDCIGAMLEEARQHPNMRVLSACRKFDVDNDFRLRNLVGEDGIAHEFPVEPFDAETVRSLLERLGLNPSGFSAKQFDLLALPLHMRILSEVVQGKGVDTNVLQTTKDLYRAFWDHKEIALRLLHVPDGHMRMVIDPMVDHMTDRELLFVPASLLDNHAYVVSAMTSENILVRDGSRVSFFHESFLDYAFARRMEATGEGLAAYVLAREQSLFVRSQVRQVLLHRRDLAPQDALRDIDAILNNDDIRPHLKAIVISLMGALDDPTEDEWRLLEPSLRSDLSDHLLRSIYGSAPWFDLLDAIGVLDRWLHGTDEAAINRAIWLMHGVLRSRPDRVAQLLAPFLGRSATWNQRLLSTTLSADLETSRQMFDLALKMVNSGAADDALVAHDGFPRLWHAIDTLAGANAEWATELTAACCNRLLALTLAASATNPFNALTGPHGSDSLGVRQAADGAPDKFIDLLLPFVYGALNVSTDQSKAPPWRDPIWHPEYYANGHSFGDNLLLAMESAVRWLAKNDTDAFRQLAAQWRSSNFETIHFLLVRGYEVSGKTFADEAANYMAIALAKFGGRYPGRARWAVARLIQAVTPHCSDARLAKLEQAILAHHTEFEGTPQRSQYRGYAQLVLLSAVDESRLSPNASRRLGELRRRLSDPGEPGPSIMTSGMVKSPIPETSACHMTDANWLSAMAQHDREYSPYTKDAWAGGAVELSRVLESLTKQDPTRFANLAHQMPDEANPVYFEAILQGLTGSDVGDRPTGGSLSQMPPATGPAFGPLDNQTVGPIP